jgi:hypothetical protein
MATPLASLTDAALTPREALLTDEIANEVYASQYAERKMSRFVIGSLCVLLLGSFGAIVSLAHKPVVNRYIRIDEMGRAQAIAYTDLNYTPREGEVRTFKAHQDYRLVYLAGEKVKPRLALPVDLSRDGTTGFPTENSRPSRSQSFHVLKDICIRSAVGFTISLTFPCRAGCECPDCWR